MGEDLPKTVHTFFEDWESLIFKALGFRFPNFYQTGQSQVRKFLLIVHSVDFSLLSQVTKGS